MTFYSILIIKSNLVLIKFLSTYQYIAYFVYICIMIHECEEIIFADS